MNFYAWTALVNAVTTSAVALFVWLRRRDDDRRITFVYVVGSIAVWSSAYFLWQISTTASAALFFCRALVVGCGLIPPTFLHHTAHVVGATKRPTTARMIRLSYLAAAVVLLADMTPLVVRGVRPKLMFPFWPDPGPGWYLYTGVFIVDVIYSLQLLTDKFRRSTGAERRQLRYLLIGSAIAFCGGATNFLLWYDIPIPPVGNVVVPFYVALAALAAIRYQFMDIRIVITRTGLLLATYMLVLGLPFVLGWTGEDWLRRFLAERWWLAPLGLCTVLATIGPFAYAYLRRQAEARLLRDQIRYRRILERAARGMTRVRDLGILCKLIVRVISRTVRVEQATLLLWDKDDRRYRLAASDGPRRMAVQSQYALDAGHPLIQWLLKHRRVLSHDDPAIAGQVAIEQELQHLGVSLIVPGLIESELIGFLVLGAKRSGGSYSSDDVHAFATLANEAAIALENAKSYDELKKVNEQLRAAYERLIRQERLAAAGQFATGMAHEIKNPLSAIKTFAQYLPQKYADPAFREKFFRIVQSEIDRINSIVHDLMDFARPAPLDIRPLAISELLDDTLALLSNQSGDQGVEVSKHFDVNGLTIQADAKQLRQVFLNLILNSLEAMPSGGQLRVHTQLRDLRLLIQIEDTGCGIPDDCQAKLFDPFFTTKERGMGLGLATVRGIIERHGGQIVIRSQSGQGTTVEVSLPVSAPAG